jgi:hypothetical protein
MSNTTTDSSIVTYRGLRIHIPRGLAFLLDKVLFEALNMSSELDYFDEERMD